MNNSLPQTLSDAEEKFQSIIINNISLIDSNYLAINLKFEGLKIMPVAFRLANKLISQSIAFKLLWSDAGSVALAKRDRPDLKEFILSYSDINSGKYIPNKDELLIAISPQPYDYEDFQLLTTKHSGKFIMINGKLEDSAVGIGTIGRDRRKSFITSWFYIYALEPLSNCALMKEYPNNWSLFRKDNDGYRYIDSSRSKPDQEMIDILLDKNKNL